MNPTTITIGEVRFSYANVFQPQAPANNPQAEPKFSVTILVPKTNAQAKAAIDAAINSAIEAGVSAKWNGVRPPVPSICVHDGDGVRPSDGQPFGQECKGHWVFTASCKADRPPFVVDAQVQKIINPADVYSGCYGNVNVTFFAYNSAGKKGIGCGLNGIQKTPLALPPGLLLLLRRPPPAGALPRSSPPPVHGPPLPRLPAGPMSDLLGPRFGAPFIFKGGGAYASSSLH